MKKRARRLLLLLAFCFLLVAFCRFCCLPLLLAFAACFCCFCCSLAFAACLCFLLYCLLLLLALLLVFCCLFVFASCFCCLLNCLLVLLVLRLVLLVLLGFLLYCLPLLCCWFCSLFLLRRGQAAVESFFVFLGGEGVLFVPAFSLTRCLRFSPRFDRRPCSRSQAIMAETRRVEMSLFSRTEA